MRIFDGTAQPDNCHPQKRDAVGGRGKDKSWKPLILRSKKADDCGERKGCKNNYKTSEYIAEN